MKIPALLAGKKPQNIAEGEKRKGLGRRRAVPALIGAALVVAAAVLLVVFAGNAIDQSEYSVRYVVTADPEAGGLEVDVSFDIEKLSSDRMIFLYKGMTDATWRSCADSSGAEVPFEEDEDFVAIGPIDDSGGRLDFKYYVGIGVTESDSTYETSYTYGCIFDDLLAFSGEYALLMPLLNPDSFDSIDKYVKRFSIEFVTPPGWQAIIPYQTPLGGASSIVSDKPSWDFFNSISKSSFCFGYFEKFDYGGALKDATVYLDKAVMTEINQYALEALVTFFNYYAEVFGSPLNETPVVLLRNSPVDGAVITGGVGSCGSAVSINLNDADDFKTLSNVIYHSFFDSKVRPRNLRYVTNDWIYKGLADFYVGVTASLLPTHVRDAYSINLGIDKTERYLRYLYFSLKEPGFLVLSPSDEGGMYDAQREFYMNVKVPLLIDAINHSVETRTGRGDGFIRALVENGAQEKPMDVEKLIRAVCGNDYDAVKMYIAGLALIPNYDSLSADDVAPEDIVYMLDQDEQYYAYLFTRKNLYYPYAPVFLLDEGKFMDEVEKRGIRYNTDEVQNAVKSFSATLDRLLLQYAMWASLAGIDDVTAPNIIRLISQPDVIEAWTVLCESIGYEVGIRSSMKS
jgi:hypothetical protein